MVIDRSSTPSICASIADQRREVAPHERLAAGQADVARPPSPPAAPRAARSPRSVRISARSSQGRPSAGMQYWQRKLQRSVTETRRSPIGRPCPSRSGSSPSHQGYPSRPMRTPADATLAGGARSWPLRWRWRVRRQPARPGAGQGRAVRPARPRARTTATLCDAGAGAVAARAARRQPGISCEQAMRICARQASQDPTLSVGADHRSRAHAHRSVTLHGASGQRGLAGIDRAGRRPAAAGGSRRWPRRSVTPALDGAQGRSVGEQPEGDHVLAPVARRGCRSAAPPRG